MSASALDLHEGPWSEADYLSLPTDRRRLELLDGSLLMSPAASGRHQMLSSRLWLTLERHRPAGVRVFEAVNVRLAAERILVPDLVLVRRADPDFTVLGAAEVAGVIEIVSPGSTAADRAITPRLYAEAGIELYIRLELAGPSAALGRLDGAHYRWEGPQAQLRLTDPFEVAVDLPDLLAADRAPGLA